MNRIHIVGILMLALHSIGLHAEPSSNQFMWNNDAFEERLRAKRDGILGYLVIRNDPSGPPCVILSPYPNGEAAEPTLPTGENGSQSPSSAVPARDELKLLQGKVCSVGMLAFARYYGPEQLVRVRGVLMKPEKTLRVRWVELASDPHQMDGGLSLYSVTEHAGSLELVVNARPDIRPEEIEIVQGGPIGGAMVDLTLKSKVRPHSLVGWKQITLTVDLDARLGGARCWCAPIPARRKEACWWTSAPGAAGWWFRPTRGRTSKKTDSAAPD